MEYDFRKIFNDNIKRPGADALLSWLDKQDFFTAPASTRYHGAYTGGLCDHSVNVYTVLREDPRSQSYSDETIAVVALLHDVCKVNFYVTEYRNRKNPQTSQWEQYPFYTIDDRLPYGHGEKSVYIISKFIQLTTEEAMAIRWHMDAYEESGKEKTLTAAKERYPLIMLLHAADDYAAMALDRRDAS